MTRSRTPPAVVRLTQDARVLAKELLRTGKKYGLKSHALALFSSIRLAIALAEVIDVAKGADFDDAMQALVEKVLAERRRTKAWEAKNVTIDARQFVQAQLTRLLTPTQRRRK